MFFPCPPQRARDLDSKTSKQASSITCRMFFWCYAPGGPIRVDSAKASWCYTAEVFPAERAARSSVFCLCAFEHKRAGGGLS
jgi:hypothetical protein